MAQAANTGVILLQLGTPDAPTPAAVRRYLREFLVDPRVVDVPRAIWWPILYLGVLTRRPAQSAALYRKVWSPAGSPLAVTSQAQAEGLERMLSATHQTTVPVVVGMRYGHPSIASAVDRLLAAGIERLIALPMFPQYASPTTGSSLERLFDEIGRRRVVPAVRVVPPYFDEPAYLDALAAIARESLASLPERPDRLLLSFHGIPKRYGTLGDPYPRHCEATAARLADRLGDLAGAVQLTYQSRFGREEWLQPYTDVTLERLGREGARVAVMSPGFTADCLETIEEIGLRGAEQFHKAGGRVYHRIACLNDHPAWMSAMHAMVERELGGGR